MKAAVIFSVGEAPKFSDFQTDYCRQRRSIGKHESSGYPKPRKRCCEREALFKQTVFKP